MPRSSGTKLIAENRRARHDYELLDRYEAKAWRLRIEGSRGRRALERNGPVKGYQRTYREGLAAFEASVPGGFSDLPGPARDVVLEQSDDPRVRAMLDLAVPHTIEFLYGAPEYGGNRDLVGWRTTDFEGDTQPRGYTREEVVDPESSGPLDVVGDLVGPDVEAALAMGSTELLHGVLARSGGSFSAVREEVGRLAAPAPEVVAQLMTPRRGEDPLGVLTPREREVLAAMAEGRTNLGIAALLGISEGATEKHISNIFGKLQLPDSSNDHRRVLAVLTYLEA